jgi:hypothetical protein
MWYDKVATLFITRQIDMDYTSQTLKFTKEPILRTDLRTQISIIPLLKATLKSPVYTRSGSSILIMNSINFFVCFDIDSKKSNNGQHREKSR